MLRLSIDYKKIGLCVLILFLAHLSAGCSSSDDGEAASESGMPETAAAGGENRSSPAQADDSLEPVTIEFMTYSGTLTDDEFETFFAGPVNERYPHMTMKRVEYNPGAGASVMNMIAAGELPDILLSSTTGIVPLMDVGVVANLDSLVEKHDVDLSVFDPVTIDGIRTYTDEGSIIALPYAMNFSALFYNKDIFDRFGVGYPEDYMTWDDAIALGRELTRLDEGVQYRGLHPMGTDLVGFGLSLPYADPETNTGLLDTDEWRRVVQMVQEIYTMPGFAVDGVSMPPWQPFLTDKTIAMLGNWGDMMIGPIQDMINEGAVFNWDMATIPNFEEAIGYARTVDFHSLIVTATSNHKDEAFLAIAHVASDPEVQMTISRHGRLPAIVKTSEHQQHFGTELTMFEDKNLNAIFGVSPSPLNKQTLFDGDGRNLIKQAARRVAWQGADINTALREANEELNRIIQEKLGE